MSERTAIQGSKRQLNVLTSIYCTPMKVTAGCMCAMYYQQTADILEFSTCAVGNPQVGIFPMHRFSITYFHEIPKDELKYLSFLCILELWRGCPSAGSRRLCGSQSGSCFGRRGTGWHIYAVMQICIAGPDPNCRKRAFPGGKSEYAGSVHPRVERAGMPDAPYGNIIVEERLTK